METQEGGKKRRQRIREKVALIKLVNQGAYGCIYRPGFKCNGRPDASDKFVSKIQKKSSTSDNELEIGQKVAVIPNYQLHFAPVIQTCPINIANIQPKLVESCDVIQKHHGKNIDFMLNKIRYAGTDTLEHYIESQQKSRRFLAKFFELHQYLLLSIDLLADANIVHYDLKENNIMYNPSEKAPIIIDFGLSVDITSLLNAKVDDTNIVDKYQDAFYVYYGNYPPWCLEIILCSFIVQQHKIKDESKTETRWLTAKADANKLLYVVDDFFNTNNCMQLISKIAPDKFGVAKANWRQYIRELCVRKTEKQVVDTLIQSWKSWDNYGLSVIFLFLCNTYQVTELTKNTNYQDMLINTILCLPTDRYTALQTNRQLPGIIKG